MATTTYVQVVDEFRKYCASHMQVGSFYSGQTWDFQTNPANAYPAVILLPQPSVVSRGSITLRVNIFVADMVNQEGDNYDECHSDTLMIMTDIIARFKDDEDNCGFTLNDAAITVEPFTERFDDILVGWMANFEITIAYAGSSCLAPEL